MSLSEKHYQPSVEGGHRHTIILQRAIEFWDKRGILQSSCFLFSKRTDMVVLQAAFLQSFLKSSSNTTASFIHLWKLLTSSPPPPQFAIYERFGEQGWDISVQPYTGYGTLTTALPSHSLHSKVSSDGQHLKVKWPYFHLKLLLMYKDLNNMGP